MAKPKFLKLFSDEANYPGLVKNYGGRVKAMRIINFLRELYRLGKKMMMEIALGEDAEDSEPKHQKL